MTSFPHIIRMPCVSSVFYPMLFCLPGIVWVSFWDLDILMKRITQLHEHMVLTTLMIWFIYPRTRNNISWVFYKVGMNNLANSLQSLFVEFILYAKEIMFKCMLMQAMVDNSLRAATVDQSIIYRWENEDGKKINKQWIHAVLLLWPEQLRLSQNNSLPT